MTPHMTAIRFEARVRTLKGRAIVQLPEAASKRLPSRGQVAVQGTLNGLAFQKVLEPDGDSGHWLSVEGALQRAAHATGGKRVSVELKPAKEWPEPTVPADLRVALSNAPREIRELWEAITPMARWEWVRWVAATRNSDTRKRRVEVTISKMKSGKRRPCCFDLAACTDPDLAKNGRLMESE